MNHFSALLFVVPTLSGIAIFSAFRILDEKISLTVAGATSGLAFFITLLYLGTAAFGMQKETIGALLALFAALTLFVLVKTNAINYWRSLSLDNTAVRVLLVSTAFSLALVPRLFFWEEGALATRMPAPWGDIPWHMANITMFADGQSPPPQTPIFAGERLVYPFLINFFSGALLATGSDYVASLLLPAYILLPIFVTLLYIFTREVSGRAGAGVLSVILFIFAGGALGLSRIFADWQNADTNIMDFLSNLPSTDYTGSGGDSQGYHFVNPLTCMFLSQRTYQLGAPLALCILLLVSKKKPRFENYLAAGMLAGVLPLFHAYTVLALAIVIPIFAISQVTVLDVSPSGSSNTSAKHTILRDWSAFTVPAVLVGTPEVLYYFSGIKDAAGFLRWDPGWVVQGSFGSWLWFWLKNTGLFLPLIVLAFLFVRSRRVKVLAIGATLLFLASNLWLFAPWAWDNAKLLFYWYLLSLPLVSQFLICVFEARRLLLMLAFFGTLGFQTASGAVDITKTLLPKAGMVIWERDAVRFAAKVHKKTEPGSIIVTAPYHNSPVALAGRPVYLGYTGHVFSHGLDPSERESWIDAYYGGAQGKAPDVSPTHVMVGPVEEKKFSGPRIGSGWKLVAEEGPYRLYRLPN
jgi:hypothetical protein